MTLDPDGPRGGSDDDAARARGGARDDADALSAAALEAVAGAAHLVATADAMQLQALATLAVARRRQALDDDAAVDLELVDTSIAAEVSLLLRISPGAARSRLLLALRLTGAAGERDGRGGYGPATFEAMRVARVDLVRARRIADALSGMPLPEVDEAAAAELGVTVPPAATAQERHLLLTGVARQLLERVQGLVESEVLEPGSVPALADRRPGPPAGRLTPAQLDARLRRLIARALPLSHERRLHDAHEQRGCTLQHLTGPHEGQAVLTVTGRSDLLHAAFRRLDGTARALLEVDRAAAAADPTLEVDTRRTLDQARADTFVALLLGDSDTLARANGVAVELSLVAPAGTVLPAAALDDEPDWQSTRATGPVHSGPEHQPGELDGAATVPAALVRELAGDARWRRWVTDADTGAVTWVSPTTYRPTAAVARLVRARDQQCTFPTCRARARTDLDHVVPFPDGPTVPQNLTVTCRRHHRLKHHGSFRTEISSRGVVTWTTPTGTRVENPAPSHPAVGLCLSGTVGEEPPPF